MRLFLDRVQREPETLTDEDVRAYFLYLREEKKLAPSSINIAVHALRFFLERPPPSRVGAPACPANRSPRRRRLQHQPESPLTWLLRDQRLDLRARQESAFPPRNFALREGRSQTDDTAIHAATSATARLSACSSREKPMRGPPSLAPPLPGLLNKRFSAGLRAARCAHLRSDAAKTLLRWAALRVPLPGRRRRALRLGARETADAERTAACPVEFRSRMDSKRTSAALGCSRNAAKLGALPLPSRWSRSKPDRPQQRKGLLRPQFAAAGRRTRLAIADRAEPLALKESARPTHRQSVELV